jgi:hypothetical protein
MTNRTAPQFSFFRRHLPAAALVLLGLLACTLSAPAQNNGLAFWEMPFAQQAAMLRAVPSSDAARYTRLRQYFLKNGCTGSRMIEQPLGRRRGHPPNGGNLLCELPGKYSQPIVVAAFYPSHSLYSGASTGWPEAVLLPILYHALQAQPRHYTFLFAELDGVNGERTFFSRLKKDKIPQPIAFVGLDALGLGRPFFFLPPPRLVNQDGMPAARVLEQRAWYVARFQGYAGQPTWINSLQLPQPAIVPSKLLNGAKSLPRILIFSSFDTNTSPLLFRRDSDYVAFFLCGVDLGLNQLGHNPKK